MLIIISTRENIRLIARSSYASCGVLFILSHEVTPSSEITPYDKKRESTGGLQIYLRYMYVTTSMIVLGKI